MLGFGIEVLSRSCRSDEDDVQRSRSKNYERLILEKMRVWEDKIGALFNPSGIEAGPGRRAIKVPL
jgi:hypothetical protein